MACRRTQMELTQQSLLIPHKQNGAVDWTTLGNILTAAISGEVLCASYVDVKHRQVQPDFIVDTQWQYSYEENNVVVMRKNVPNSPFHCWMGRTVVDRPLREIAAFIAAPESALVFDKYIVESKQLVVLSHSDTHTDTISYYRAEARECLVTAKRDFLFYLHHAHINGKYVLAALSVDHPDYPPTEGIPRAQIQVGSGWFLEPYRDSSQSTLVSYVAHVDLIGLPPIIANRVLKRQPLNVLYVRKHLMKRQRTQSLPVPTPFPNTVDDDFTGQSGRHFEEPLPIDAFTEDQMGDQRTSEGEQPYQSYLRSANSPISCSPQTTLPHSPEGTEQVTTQKDPTGSS